MAVPREFASVLLLLKLDHSFETEFPQIASKSLEFAEMLDTEMCVVCDELRHVCQSQESTCQLLTVFPQLVTLTAADCLKSSSYK